MTRRATAGSNSVMVWYMMSMMIWMTQAKEESKSNKNVSCAR